jgi:hypothetical protein
VTAGEKAERRKLGRPLKDPGEGARPTMTFRVRRWIRDRLVEASEKSGYSISEEVERRLERSFQEMDILTRFFGREDTIVLVRAMAGAIDAIQYMTGRSWRDDPHTRQLIRQDIISILAGLERDSGASLVAEQVSEDDRINRIANAYELASPPKTWTFVMPVWQPTTLDREALALVRGTPLDTNQYTMELADLPFAAQLPKVKRDLSAAHKSATADRSIE